ncbi:conserved hypothetical protein [Methanocaldococcus vulcanius M7]|uniref:site-specific DNA-methyltransferase (adenine-specific) n=1 Tax=Methanocaldococcus vulcanius (strain ATCC 700851 / DSM 12094 / M7) TaxID=579137 RepID=C9RHN2_METVM|nr:N-6 DNA methylase [Methanocaldococcus vulcanius]ACX73084.1 conserved hypothetical protein [Methanocaldococcus vulcanius M7]
MVKVEKLLSYDGLIEYLRKNNYKEIEEGRFVVYEDEDLGVEEILVVKKGSNYKEDLKNLKKELSKSEEVLEGEKVEYGILFVDNYVLFLKKEMVGLPAKVVVLKKSLDKISPAFKKKLKKLAKDFGNLEYWEVLFDRSDIVEEFYKLYVKARELLIKNIKGIDDDEKKIKFANNLLMKLFIIWYLQEKGFLDGDKRYLINKFKEYKNLGFNSYYEFLKELFSIMMGDKGGNLTFKDNKFGEIVITGPAPFINGEIIENVEIPDEVFYIDGKTEELKKIEPKNVSIVPILNLFESRDWVVEGGDVEGDITDMMLGDIFEKQMVEEERKDSGSYYTPAKITRYISQNAIESYVLDRLNEELKTNYKNLDDFFKNEKDLRAYKLLYDILNDIRILDPACGSGHFLERAVEVLVDIYERLRDKVKELGFDGNLFIIKVADDNGNIRNENLLSIDDEEFKMRIKFHVIVSKNIYGVDINESAVGISKARLFLSIAKHFDKEKGIFVRFPNVHFNIRDGNSLIGYARMKKPERTLDAWLKFGSEKIEELKEEFKVVSELGDYLKEVSKVLNQKGDILKDIEELNKIISKKELSWLDFEKVLKIKEKLVEILLVSLNSKYAIPLNKLLRDINKKFNEKLDEMFVKEFGIEEYVSPKILREGKLKRFHWFFEFSEVFVDNGGFDVIIGNPPYVRQERINDIVKGVDYKEILSKLYKPYDKMFDFSMFFILRSLELLKDKGYHSFIITNKWLRARYGKKIRKFLKENVTIKKVIDFNAVKVFVGVTVDTMIYIVKKEKPDKDNRIFYNNPKSLENIEEGGYYVKQFNLEDDVWNFVDERTLEIKEWIEKVGVPLKELDIKIFYGIKTGFNEAFIIDDETRKKLIEEDAKSEELIKPILRGRDIGRYYVEWDKLWMIIIPAGFTKRLFKKDLPLKDAEELFKKEYPSIYKHFEPFKYKKGKGKGLVDRDDQGDYWWELRPCDYYQEFEKPKIMWQEIVREPSFYLDQSKIYGEATTFIMTSKKMNLKFLLTILNSKLSWTAIRFYGTNLGDNTARYKKAYIEKIPIRLPNNTKPYEILADYLLFLNAKEDWREKYKELINFFDKEIADSLVYELYFKEKLYNEDKEYLLNAISKHLKSINYDRWAELYWKKQLNDELTEKEEEELKQLEEENLRIIIDVYEAIKDDEEINKLIKKIKSHKWVRIIEG